jgi:hypothetical protein
MLQPVRQNRQILLQFPKGSRLQWHSTVTSMNSGIHSSCRKVYRGHIYVQIYSNQYCNSIIKYRDSYLLGAIFSFPKVSASKLTQLIAQ